MKRLYGLILILMLVGCEGIEKEIMKIGEVKEKVYKEGDTTPIMVGNAMTMVTSGDDYILFIDGKKYYVKKDIWLGVDKGETILYTSRVWERGLYDFAKLKKELDKYKIQEGLIKDITKREDIDIIGQFFKGD